MEIEEKKGEREEKREERREKEEKEKEEEEKKMVQDLESVLREGESWFLVHSKWFSSWKNYSQYLDPTERLYKYTTKGTQIQYERPSFIDNSPLLLDGELSREMREVTDFHLLHEKQWNFLFHRYGGGPPIERKVLKLKGNYYNPFQIEVHYMRIYLFKQSDQSNSVMGLFSKLNTVQEMSEKASQFFHLDSDSLRLWDYHGNTKIKVLEGKERQLQDLQIIDQQKIMIEEKDSDGKWPTDSSAQATLSYYTNLYDKNYDEGTKTATPPGLCGLRNIGNTCFMNSAIQCLSNNAPFMSYFRAGDYLDDINKDNPLSTGGELAKEFGSLISLLWGREYSVAVPRTLKSKIELNAPQFSGYSQHDSQELLLYLMDGLHEDLNRVKNKVPVPKIESDGRPDQIVAKEAWDGHLKRNDSIVVDLFQGQLKSTVVCPICNRTSTTFDPYMTLSVPLPIPPPRPMQVTVVFQDPSKIPSIIYVDVSQESSILELKKEISKIVQLEPENLFITEVYAGRFFKEFCNDDPFDQILETDDIFAYQISPQVPIETEEKDEQKPLDEKEEPSSSFLSTTFFSRAQRYPTGKPGTISYIRVFLRFSSSPHLRGIPLVVSVPRTVTFRQLYRAILVNAQNKLDKEAPEIKPFLEGNPFDSLVEVDKTLPTDLFQMIITNERGGAEKETLKEPTKDEEFVLEPFWGEVVYLVLEWNPSFESYLVSESLSSEDDSSVDSSSEEAPMNLTDCLTLFSKSEVLSPQDSWYCPNCEEHQQATKIVQLFSCPENIIIHLKRFSSGTSIRDKINTLVNFPTKGLNLTPFAVNKLSNGKELIYDLYAVTNHSGGLGGGHYTAYAKNHKNGKWYHFNDSGVSEWKEERVVSSSAYVLLYKRRDAWSGLLSQGEENVEEGDDEGREEEGDEGDEKGDTEDEVEFGWVPQPVKKNSPFF